MSFTLRCPTPRPAAILPALLIPVVVACAAPQSATVQPAMAETRAGEPAGASASPLAPGTVITDGDPVHVQPGSGIGGEAGPGASSDARVPGATLTVRPFTFSSRDAHGAPMDVTAALVTSPDGWTGEGPRPVLVIAPGTSGMADRCAPSRKAAEGQLQDAAAQEFAAAGWAVVLTDYQGLGTPGTHTYMVREPQGHAVLDAARAGLSLADATAADSPIAITGYSQGGGAAAAAAELAPSYAPELDLRGVVAGAVPADLTQVAGHIDGSTLAGAVGYSINGLSAAYPEVRAEIERLLNDRGKRMLEISNEQCVIETMSTFAGRRTSEYSIDGRSLPEHLAENPGIYQYVDRQRIGRLAPSAPGVHDPQHPR